MFSSNRNFKVWHYTVSHGQLLLRSPKTDTEDTNCDIVFVGVKYVCLPTILNDGLVIANVKEPQTVKELFPSASMSDELYRIKSNGKEYSVVASAMKAYENKLDMFETGLDWT